MAPTLPGKKSLPSPALLAGGLLLLLLSGCLPAGQAETAGSPSTATGQASALAATLEPTTAQPGATSSPTSPPTGIPTALPPSAWQDMPVIPGTLSTRMREVYRLGQDLGRAANVFSRIGDCASAAPAFLVGFDGNYDLGEYARLQPVVDYFQGSFRRPSLAAKAGLNTAGVLTTLWTDAQCQPAESLLACQYRLDNPAFAFIALGTNEAYYIHRDPGSFERNLRLILEETLAAGIIPILVTKADNVEGDHAINATLTRLALEYEMPLWNFWLAVQPLPGQGMIEPEHLSSVSYINYTDFSIPHAMEYGMQVRNLGALQILYFLWEQLVAQAGSAP